LEYRPDLGPSCSYVDVATLLFTESQEDTIIIINLTANRLLPGGSGYNACS